MSLLVYNKYSRYNVNCTNITNYVHKDVPNLKFWVAVAKENCGLDWDVTVFTDVHISLTTLNPQSACSFLTIIDYMNMVDTTGARILALVQITIMPCAKTYGWTLYDNLRLP